MSARQTGANTDVRGRAGRKHSGASGEHVFGRVAPGTAGPFSALLRHALVMRAYVRIYATASVGHLKLVTSLKLADKPNTTIY